MPVLNANNWTNFLQIREPQKVALKTCGAEVYLRPLTAAAYSMIDSQFESSADSKDRRKHSLAVIAACVVDAEGQPIFTTEQLRTQVEWPVVNELFDYVAKFLEIRKEDREGN